MSPTPRSRPLRWLGALARCVGSARPLGTFAQRVGSAHPIGTFAQRVGSERSLDTFAQRVGSARWLGALATVLAVSGCAAPLTAGPGPSAAVVSPSAEPQPAEIFAGLDCVEASKQVSSSARGAVPNNFDAVEAVWCEPVAPVDGFGLPLRTDDTVTESDFVVHRSTDVAPLVELSRQPNGPCTNPNQLTGQQPHFLPMYVTDASGSAAIIDWPMTNCSRRYSVDRAEIVEQVFGVELPEEWDRGWSIS